ncbi:unnamed protein product [Meloidogyne enterolobii]|uniref:Uncharacterized protein n=1 Tax=Meloidogyne enterolobii TaxID=390850 RepID=A0ACB0ZJR3_MELEN
MFFRKSLNKHYCCSAHLLYKSISNPRLLKPSHCLRRGRRTDMATTTMPTRYRMYACR